MGALAIAATPALAHEFTASSVGPTKGKGEEQLLQLGPFKVLCEKAVTKGQVTETSSSTLVTEVKYGHCGDVEGPKFAGHAVEYGASFRTPVIFEYHANGVVNNGSETEEVKIKGGAVLLLINGGPKFKCTLTWPSQTIPLRAVKKPLEEYSAAVYSNEEVETGRLKKFPPLGIQHRLLIENEFKGMEYSYKGVGCNGWTSPIVEETKGKNGSYIGSFEEELVNGNLEFH
ncbi:MAG TPA: hypothetical protein VES65_08295 [Solirubrobacteraceae bacterium]|nr:hypothetical protein [Solirubrobacteraceae bacterium]